MAEDRIRYERKGYPAAPAKLSDMPKVPKGPAPGGFVRDTHDAENCPDCSPITTPSGERVWIHRLPEGTE